MNISIIGAGITGLTLAVELRKKYINSNITIYEERKNEIGGNCFDSLNKNSYFQKYGPHIFHTKNKDIWDFLNSFSTFNLYQHKVLSYIDGNYYNIPLQKNDIHFNDINENDYTNAEEYLIALIGKEKTEKFFKNYSEKQWGISFNLLPIEVVKRIPLNENNDQRYFSKDKYQGIPNNGFSKLCKEMLKFSKAKIKYKSITYDTLPKADITFITGSIDKFYNFQFGKLKYRYIDFKFEEYNKEYQNNSVINFPLDYDFTRITEFNKFLITKNFKKSIVCFEYSSDNEKYEPCYPIFWDNTCIELYQKYLNINKDLYFIGRLANYKYINIDVAIENAINLVKYL